MKILLLSELYPPYYKGGHEIRFSVLGDALSKRGHEVLVLTSIYGVNAKQVNGNIYRLLHYLDIGNTKGLRKRYGQIKMALLARVNYFIAKQTIEDLKPDIVYAGRLSQISIYPLKAIKKLGLPTVHHFGNYDFQELVNLCILEPNPLKRFYRRVIYGFHTLDKLDLRYMITVSEAVKKTYVESGIPEKNISAIHARGVPPELIAKKTELSIAPETGPIRLLYVGRIAREKGVHVAIEAVKYLVDDLTVNDATLDIIGEGDEGYIESLCKLIEDLKMTSYVRFRKTIPHEDIFQEYRRYHILLFPSIWEEPFSGVLIEAMSQGLPIVATNSGGTPELIIDGWNGFLVPPGDSKKMAEAVYNLVQNPAIAEKMARNGIDLISKKYNIEQITDRIERYLMDVVSKERKA